MSNKESNIEKTNFDAFIQAVGSEIEQAQVRLIVAANAQMLFHYWKVGNYILYHQQLHGWGSKIIKQLAKAIRLHYPEKKGYSERNLTYMCQFAKAYPLRALQSFIETDARLSVPTIQSVTNEVLKLNDKQFTQELTAQIQSIDCQSLAITQEVPAQFEDVGKTGLSADCTSADTRTLMQKGSMLALLRELRLLFPKALIVGHHDLNPVKPCPCFDAVKEYRF